MASFIYSFKFIALRLPEKPSKFTNKIANQKMT